MNLILSDVEETIMIVDQPEGVPGAQPVINVSLSKHMSCGRRSRVAQVAKRKMDMLFVRGDGVILVRSEHPHRVCLLTQVV